MVEIPDSLVDRLKAREAVLVAGVGCGELAGRPGWSALVESLAAHLPFPDERAQVTKLVAAGRMTDAVALVRDVLSHGALCDAIRETLPDGVAVPETIGFTASLPWRAMVTTGFDDLWQQALAAARPDRQLPEVIVGTDSTARIRALGPRSALMHLFGASARPESLCFGSSDSRSRLALAGGLPWLGDLYRRRSLVLVGFRARDPDLSWLTAWMSVTPASTTAHFIFLDASGEAEPEVEARLLELRTGMKVISCRGGTAEAIERLALLAGEIGGDLAPPDVDVDYNAWLGRWAANPNDPEPREVVARAAAALRAEERWDRLTELLLHRLSLQEDKGEQLAALNEVATIFRDRLDAPAGALRAGLAALRLAPGDDQLWDDLCVDAAAAGAWTELVLGAREAVQTVGSTPEAARIWRGIASVTREQLGLREDALAAYGAALHAEPGHPQTRDHQLQLLRELERWGELVAALRAGAGEAQEPARAATLLREAAEVLERQLGDIPGAISAYESVLAIGANTSHHGQADGANVDGPASVDGPATVLERLYQGEGRWADLAFLLDRRARSSPPGEAAEPRRRRAEILAQHLGDPDTAAVELEDLIATAPDDRAALQLLERIYEGGQRHDEFLGTLRRLADVAPSPEERLALLRRLASESETRAGGEGRLVAALEDILRLEPLDADAFASLLVAYRAAGRFAAMTEVLHRRLDGTDADDQKVPLYLVLGEIYDRDLDDPEKAFEAYESAERAGDQRPELFELLVRLAERLGRWALCAAALQRWAAVAPEVSTQVDLRLRAVLLLTGHLNERAAAEEELTRILELAPHDPRVLAALARVCRDGGAFERAVELFLDAAEHEPVPHQQAQMLVEAAAIVRTELKQDDLARDLYIRALAARPAHVPAGRPLAELYAARREWAALEPILDMLAAHDVPSASPSPEEAQRMAALHLQRAAVALELANPDKALTCFVAAHDLQPESLPVLQQFAAFRLQRRDWKEAADLSVTLRRLHRAELSDADVLELTMRIARCRAEEGDLAAAITWYEDARSLDPKHTAAIEGLAATHAAQKDWNSWIKDRRLLMAVVPPDEQAQLLEEIGDVYLERLGERKPAADAYEAALTAAPGRRSTLHKTLELHTKEKEWEAAAHTLVRLAEVETEKTVRAQTLYTAALIWRDELGRAAEAAGLLERALDEAPHMEEFFEILDKLHRQAGNWEDLARSYGRMIKRLPSTGETERLARLWSQLGNIAHRRLRDHEMATTAFEVAASLEPGNLRHQETLADIYVRAGADERDKAITAHRRLLARDPNRLESYQALATLYGEIGAIDQRWCIAATLSFMRKADSTLEMMFQRLRPRQVRMATGRFTDEVWQRLVHPDEDRLIDTLFVMCGAYAAAPAAQTATALGLKPKQRVELATDPRPLVRAVGQVAATLDAPIPDLFLLDDPERASTIVNLRGKAGPPRPTLLLGSSMLQRQDQFELAFDVAKLMAFLRPERFLRYALMTPAMLETALRAILAVTKALPAGDGVANAEEVQGLSAHLRKALPPALAEQVGAAARKLVVLRGESLDMAKWVAATELTAARAALLINGDLGAAARVLWGEPAASAASPAKDRLKDLIAFSISEEYFACRKLLGLVVA